VLLFVVHFQSVYSLTFKRGLKCVFYKLTRDILQMATQTGIVKFFNHEKGFGFITPDEEGSKDVFVHKNSIQSGHLNDGSKVEFDTESSPKGLNAINVVVVD